jgi:hypothetical protein
MFAVLRKHPTLATLAVVSLFWLAFLYVPPMFDTPKEALARAQRECGWAVQTRQSVESKCFSFTSKLEENGTPTNPWAAGDAWMQVAEYRLVQGDVQASKDACRKATYSYRALDESAARLSNMANAEKICQALLNKYGP